MVHAMMICVAQIIVGECYALLSLYIWTNLTMLYFTFQFVSGFPLHSKPTEITFLDSSGSESLFVPHCVSSQLMIPILGCP